MRMTIDLRPEIDPAVVSRFQDRLSVPAGNEEVKPPARSGKPTRRNILRVAGHSRRRGTER